MLSGRRGGKGLEGEVRVNGATVDAVTMKGLSGYVMQVRTSFVLLSWGRRELAGYVSCVPPRSIHPAGVLRCAPFYLR